jgi:phosphate transport system protein
MLKGCIDAFIGPDPERAREICRSDREVDKLHSANYRRLDELIAKYPDESAVLIQHLSLSRYLERIADLSTNIAEDVIYLVEGKIVRHRNPGAKA